MKLLRLVFIVVAALSFFMGGLYLRKTMILLNQEYVHFVPIGRRISFGDEAPPGEVIVWSTCFGFVLLILPLVIGKHLLKASTGRSHNQK